MTRVPDYFSQSTIKDKQVSAIWRGIGFVSLVGLAIGACWLAGYLLGLNVTRPFLPFPVPRGFTVTINPRLPTLPGKLLVQIGAALLIDVVAYSVMVTVYALLFPIRKGPTDADQPRGTGRRSRIR